ncbi:TonB-dependent receptor [Henriciella litoralis]|uniref:TonB-dependent receptor n=1 Tax=Henriciella litoralis TaxID=568102 RepID=UPI0009FDB173|nr:TonB-dependent receptor [Henriciella litoralis]
MRNITGKAVFAIALAAILTPAATAQDGDEDSDRAVMKEVVVTARKRAESVQDVPLSVTAVSEEDLRAKAVVTIEQVTAVTSGLTVSRNANNIPTFRIRGLGTGGGSESFEQSVALFIDGTYLGRVSEYNQPLYDLERLEVIKGTQAALLAKNTSLGAISLTTRKPGHEFSYDLSTQYEMELGSSIVDVGVTLPVSDTLSLRLAGQAMNATGPVKNTALGTEQSNDSLAGRFTAVWTPTARFNAIFSYNDYEVEMIGSSEEAASDTLGILAARGALEGIQTEARLNYKNQVQGSIFGDIKDRTTGRRAILTLNYDIGDFTLTSVTAGAEYNQVRFFDTDVGPGLWADQNPVKNGNEQFSQELRIASPAGDRFNWLAGLYYQNEDFYIHRKYDIYSDLAAGIAGGSPIAGANQDNYDQSTDTYSLFSQANYEFNDRLTGSLGLRVTNEKRSAEYMRIASRSGLFTTFLFPDLVGSPPEIDETSVDGSIGLQYELNDDHMIYASFSRGSKGEGFIAQPTNIPNSSAPKETADSFEIGAKINFNGGYFNIAAFDTQIEALQQALFNGTRFDTSPYDLSSRGFEFDTRYHFSPSWGINATATYADVSYETDISPQADGLRPLNTPEWSGSANLRYDAPISDDLEITAEAGIDYSSELYWSLRNQNTCTGSAPSNTIPCTDAYTKVNARIMLKNSSQGWDLALVGRNLTDEKTIAYARASTFINGVVNASLAPPRTVALQFSIHR